MSGLTDNGTSSEEEICCDNKGKDQREYESHLDLFSNDHGVNIQSLPKVLEHLHYFLTRRAISPSPPSEQC